MKYGLLVWMICCCGFLFARPDTDPSKIHVVKKGETLYGIARKYGITEEELKSLNPYLKSHELFAGEKLKISSGNEKAAQAESEPKKNNSAQVIPVKNSSVGKAEKRQPVFHEVLKGETAFSLSRKYKTQVDSILQWNQLQGSNVKVGQQLIVGFKAGTENVFASGGNSPVPTAAEKEKKPEVVSSFQNETSTNSPGNTTADAGENSTKQTNSYPPKASFAPITNYNDGNASYITESGAANWIVNDDDSSNLYVLHRTAPVGTVVSVTNLANHKSVSAKVVGKLPGTSLNEPILILVSDGVARALGVSVEKFDVEISYSVPRQPN